jgi:hypothetical protein
MGAGFSCLFGFKTYLLLRSGVLLVASVAGVWLFYVQHQFEGVYWERREEWDYCTAALKGSSFYKLPKILQWFSGNIGFHHIHHLSPRIPNYNLEKCHRAGGFVSNGETGDPVCELQSIDLSSVGRAAPRVGGLPRLEKPAARSGGPGPGDV